ncbi:unknown [Bacillus sp. CAG:988]|nr:unknown [Bacillus sp. CAG:988]
MNKKMNKKLNNQKKKLFLFIGIAVIVVIVLAIVFFVALGGKKNDNGGSTGQTVLFDDAYNNTVNATNYKIQFTISKDDSSLVFTSNIDDSYQEITEQKTTPDESLLSRYFVDYENLDLYYLSEIGNTMDHFEGIYDLKAIYTVLDQNSAKNVVDDDTVEYVIPNLQAYNYMFTYLDIVKEIADIDFESIADDVVITVNSNGEYLSSLTFQLDGVNFEYVFSDFNAVTDLTLPEVTVIEQKEDETGIILPEED